MNRLRNYTVNPLTASAGRWTTLDQIDPTPSGEQERLQRQADEIQRQRAFWIGNWANVRNWREQRSLDFTNDYFGKVEAAATIRTLYEVLRSEVLSELDSLGFDIRSYRDREGRMTINAEKIDQLVIGEKVEVTKQPATGTQQSAGPNNQRSERTG